MTVKGTVYSLFTRPGAWAINFDMILDCICEICESRRKIKLRGQKIVKINHNAEPRLSRHMKLVS